MTRAGLRALMAVVGVTLLVAYLGAASLAYWVLASLWAARPDPVTMLLVVVGTALVFGTLSYAFGTRRLLSNLNATYLPPERASRLYDRVGEFAAEMDIDVPDVYVGMMAAPNAFAFGGVRSGAVVLDRSLFRLLTTAELDAILAHELAHLESHDGLVQTLAFSLGQTVAGVLSVALFPVALFVTGIAKAWAWLAGRPGAWAQTPFGRFRAAVDGVTVVVLVGLTLAVRAHSRNREFAADDRAAELTGRPLALASALRKIQRATEPGWGVLSPLYVHSDDENPITEWFSTHPSLDDRIERLRERAATGSVRVPVE
ncbi:M48 family metallopeptidase [Halarchaeum sp. CBA1220]|uniref:M48 family metallopeptidase n=1 Tax=Halarchaeum sp. CBA1220 TaxID=1853682 RepID=UPI0021047954|nr:M48 family metalloprotease [Halarchaeum sp. CBA1220]